MWNKSKPRPKLTIHTTDRKLDDSGHASGKAKFLAIAVVILLLIAHYFSSGWWMPKPANLKQASLPPAEAVVEEPEIPVAVEEKLRPLIPYGPDIPAWRRYAIPVRLDNGKAKIAIVIDDMGVNRPKSREVMELSPALTLAFLPYANQVADMAEEARRKGHELMVHVPMEPLSASADPGPNALRTAMPPDELKTAIDANLSKFGKYVGVNNHMGSKFTQDAPAMRELMDALKEREVFFLDSKTIAASRAYSEAKAAGVPAVERDVFLDDDPSLEAVRHQMGIAEAIAKRRGFAVVIGHPKENTIQVLKEFLSRADAKGFQVVPLSAIVKMSEAKVLHAMR